MLLPSKVLKIESTEKEMQYVIALDSANLETTLRKDIMAASSLNTLVVETMRFNPSGKVRVSYKICSPSK
jgi:hypothetical protein